MDDMDSLLEKAKREEQKALNAVNQQESAESSSPSWKAKILSPLKRIIVFLWRKYMGFFKRHAYTKNEHGSESLTAKGVGRALGLTILYGVLIIYGLPILLTTIRDGYHVATATEQTFFFGKPEFNSNLGYYQVTACESQTSCQGGDSALIFDIPDNNALDIVFTFTRLKGYDPEHEIVSAFNSEYQKCTVITKGTKPVIINFIVGRYRWHPKVIRSATCSPLVNIPQ